MLGLISVIDVALYDASFSYIYIAEHNNFIGNSLQVFVLLI